MRRYRYLSEPRRISKGKLHMVLALHAQGQTLDQIHTRTGCPRQTIQRYVVDFEEGRQQRDFDPYYGIDLSPKDLCRLHGTWYSAYGVTPQVA
jgi:hypothetical protein